MVPETEVTKSLIAALAAPEYVLAALVLVGVGYLANKFGTSILNGWISQNTAMAQTAGKIAEDIGEFKDTANYIKDDIRELNGKIATVINQIAVHDVRISNLETRK